MTTITLPKGLKPIVENYSIGAPGGVISTEVAGGAPRYALDYDRGVQQHRVTIPCSELQFSVWTAFFIHTIKKGAYAFEMELNSGFGSQPHTVNMVPGTCTATPAGSKSLWMVNFIVETESAAYGMTAADAQALIDLYDLEGDASMALLNAIAIFANQDTLVLA